MGKNTLILRFDQFSAILYSLNGLAINRGCIPAEDMSGSLLYGDQLYRKVFQEFKTMGYGLTV